MHAELHQGLGDGNLGQCGEVPKSADDAGYKVGSQTIIAYPLCDLLFGQEDADKANDEYPAVEQRHEQLCELPCVVHPFADFVALEPSPGHNDDRQRHQSRQVPPDMINGKYPCPALLHFGNLGFSQHNLIAGLF